MTDNEIIKALECCQSEDSGMCRICPFHSDTYSGCWYELHKDALDLINRQKAEIKSLKEKAKRWKENYESQQVVVGDFREIINKQAKELKTAKAEAVKEFAERLKSYLHQDDFGTPDEYWKPESEFANMIDNLLKETVGATQ